MRLSSLLVSLFVPSVVLCAAASAETNGSAAGQQIGTAQLRDDNTIIVRLKTKSRSGLPSEAEIHVNSSNPLYEELLRSLGGLHKGEEKPLRNSPQLDRIGARAQ